ncbi:hypothetical protein RFI_13858, partial [Reticulomyxa filosa]
LNEGQRLNPCDEQMESDSNEMMGKRDVDAITQHLESVLTIDPQLETQLQAMKDGTWNEEECEHDLIDMKEYDGLEQNYEDDYDEDYEKEENDNDNDNDEEARDHDYNDNDDHSDHDDDDDDDACFDNDNGDENVGNNQSKDDQWQEHFEKHYRQHPDKETANQNVNGQFSDGDSNDASETENID